MEFKTVILRFRDLVTENNVTIARHKDMIDKKGYVWWGWWNKGNEKLPFEEFCVLKGEIESKPKYFYLMDSGQEKLYKAECLDIKCSGGDKILSPELECTPNYYNEQKYYAWFKFDKIEECEADEVKNYTYVNVDSLFVENHSNYEKFYGKRVYNIKEMIQQNRTIWFVRNYNENDDSDYEIQLLNSSVVEPHDFSDKYFETGSDTLLWLSDLHFGTDDVFKVKMAKETDVTLTAHIRNAYNDLNKVGGLIITGDITSLGNPEGFTKAEEFIVDLNRNLTRKLISENIIFCPGNHDFVRKNEMLGNGVPEMVSENPDSISAYKEFYSSIHNLNPNEYMACGRRLLMSTGRTVEIVALNSLILQQYKDFEGHGFLSDKQLEYVANKMGWEENVQTNSVRIVIMHHHCLPTCLVEQVDVKKPSSVVYDAERLVQWLAKYDIKLLLHGHKHQSFVSKIGHFDNSIYEIDEDRMKNIYVIGMGGTGAFNCENKFSTLTFCNDHIELKFFRIYADNTETDKCVQTLRIPI